MFDRTRTISCLMVGTLALAVAPFSAPISASAETDVSAARAELQGGQKQASIITEGLADDMTETESLPDPGCYPIPRAHYFANEKAAAEADASADGDPTSIAISTSNQESDADISTAFTDADVDDDVWLSPMASSSVEVDGSAALAYAKSHFDGMAYVYGGRSLSGVDCAGLVMYSANQTLGTNYDLINTDAARLYGLCKPISKVALKPGDLVFWKGTYGSSLNWISHVGFYAGNNKVYMAGDPVGTYAMDSVKNIAGSKAEQLYARILVDKSVFTLNANRIPALTRTYTSFAITPYSGTMSISNPSATLKEGTDYTVSYANNINAGTATATIKGKGKYSGTAKRTFTISKLGFSDDNFTWSGDWTYKYTGKAICPKPRIWHTENGKKVMLTNGKDYTLSYKNNVKLGKAVIYISFKGNCSGKLTRPFKINKGDNPLDTWSKYTYSCFNTSLRGGAVKSNSGVLIYRKGIGKITYSKKNGSRCLSVTSDGRIVVAKGTGKGTYSMNVNIKAAGNSNYNAKTVRCPVSVTVKARS